jgi:hypothetical protein
MAKDLYCFCFKPSQAQNADCSIATNLRDFRGARKGSKGRPATDVRIFFDESMTRRFVNPLWLSDVNKAVKESSYGGKVKGNTNSLTCTTTWTFSGAEDPELRRFDDFYEEILRERDRERERERVFRFGFTRRKAFLSFAWTSQSPFECCCRRTSTIS